MGWDEMSAGSSSSPNPSLDNIHHPCRLPAPLMLRALAATNGIEVDTTAQAPKDKHGGGKDKRSSGLAGFFAPSAEELERRADARLAAAIQEEEERRARRVGSAEIPMGFSHFLYSGVLRDMPGKGNRDMTGTGSHKGFRGYVL